MRGTPGADAFCIAFVMLLICVPLLPVSERFRPKVYPTPKAEFVIAKDHDRIEPVALRFTAGLPWSCDQVRAFAALHSKEDLARLARRLSAEQRAEAIRCLRKDKSA